jgi:hypothetical protein
MRSSLLLAHSARNYFGSPHAVSLPINMIGIPLICKMYSGIYVPTAYGIRDFQ